MDKSESKKENYFNDKTCKILKKIDQTNKTLYKITQPAIETLNPVIEKLKLFEIKFHDTLNVITNSIQNFVNPIQEILKKFDYNPFLKMFQTLNNYLSEDFLKNLDDAILKELYKSKWFPHAIYTTNTELCYQLCNILDTTKKGYKKRTKEIDKVIFKFYNKKILREFLSNCNRKEYPVVKKIFRQSIMAYHRKEYALTISALSSLWQGIIEQKNRTGFEYRTDKKTKEHFENLTKQNPCNELINLFFNECIYYNCKGPEDVIKDVPGRHSIAHSWYCSEYPSQKSALNAIIFTDFLLSLNQIKKEDK